MRNLVLPALGVALALAACDSTPNDSDAAASDTAAMSADGTTSTAGTAPAATVTQTATVAAPDATNTGDKVMVGPGGVSADVGDANTRVKINTDGNTVAVEKK